MQSFSKCALNGVWLLFADWAVDVEDAHRILDYDIHRTLKRVLG